MAPAAERETRLMADVASARSPMDRLMANVALAEARYRFDDATLYFDRLVRVALRTPQVSDATRKKIKAQYWTLRSFTSNRGKFLVIRRLLIDAINDRSLPISTRRLALAVVGNEEFDPHLMTTVALVLSRPPSSDPAAANLRSEMYAVAIRGFESDIKRAKADEASGAFGHALSLYQELGGNARRWSAGKSSPLSPYIAISNEGCTRIAAERAMLDAVNAERAGRWSAARDSYQLVADICNGVNAPWSANLAPWQKQAERSMPIMEALSHMPAASDDVRVIGFDGTLPSDWRSSVGSEGWALFAYASPADLCGGPRILDGTFSYLAYLGDPANQVRHWRDAIGYQSRPHSDLPLVTPKMPDQTAISFLDDNGESYPTGCGPDLFLDVTVPAGQHILSLPVHYSEPKILDATYGFYILSSAGMSVDAGKPEYRPGDEASCLAALTLPASVGAGCARFAVKGPARYTLVARRLNGLNSNLPAIFLDPDTQDPQLYPMSQEFDNDDLTSLGLLHRDVEAGTVGPSPDYNSPAYALQGVVAKYRRLVMQEGSPSGGGSSVVAPNRKSEVSASWDEIVKRPSPFVNDSGLTSRQRAVAAWLVWRSRLHSRLKSGEAKRDFAQYLQLRYPAEEAGSIDALRSRAEALRSAGRIGDAEAADDLAWNGLVKRVGLDNPAALPEKDEIAKVRELWRLGARPYLVSQEIWKWQGADGPRPVRQRIALDVGYACGKAQLIVRSLAARHSPSIEAGNAVPMPVIDPLSTAAGHAQNLVDVFQSMDRVNGGEKAAGPKEIASPEDQPTREMIYVAACEPFLGDLSGEKTDQVCLLRPDQLEMLARALLARRHQMADNKRDAEQALKIVEYVKAHFPSYPGQDQLAILAKTIQLQITN